MGPLERSRAVLRVVGDDLIPSEISGLLGCEPSHAHARGEPIFGQSEKSAVRKTGAWRLKADETAPEDLDGQVQQVLGRLTQDMAVWHLLSQRYRVELFCGWFMGTANEGVVVAPATLSALGARNITLSIDIYAPGP